MRVQRKKLGFYQYLAAPCSFSLLRKKGTLGKKHEHNEHKKHNKHSEHNEHIENCKTHVKHWNCNTDGQN